MDLNLIIKIIILIVFSAGVVLLLKTGGSRFSRFSLKKHVGKARFLKNKVLKLKLLGNIQMEKRDKEIYEAISMLRNLTIIGVGKTMSADTVLEELIEMKSSLRNVYEHMLGLLRINQSENATNLLYEYIGSEISRDFGRLLLKWDEVNPEELTETLVSHQRTINEIRKTNQRKRDEVISDLIYFPVVLNVIVILINFIYVGYFMEQQTLFQNFF